MNTEKRLSTYARQQGLDPLEGTQNLLKLTPAQRRRFLKKQRHQSKRRNRANTSRNASNA